MGVAWAGELMGWKLDSSLQVDAALVSNILTWPVLLACAILAGFRTFLVATHSV